MSSNETSEFDKLSLSITLVPLIVKKTVTNSFAILWVFLPLFFGYLSPVLDAISLCPHIKAPTLAPMYKWDLWIQNSFGISIN